MRGENRSTWAGNNKSAARKLVLFVCVENTFRSVLSESIFNARAPAGEWKAESAGVRPAASINPFAADLLHEIAIQIGAKIPRDVTPELIRRADRIVTFGCLDRCPIEAKEKSEDWPIPPATGRTFEELQTIRDELAMRVARLISELSPQGNPWADS